MSPEDYAKIKAQIIEAIDRARAGGCRIERGMFRVHADCCCGFGALLWPPDPGTWPIFERGRNLLNLPGDEWPWSFANGFDSVDAIPNAMAANKYPEAFRMGREVAAYVFGESK